jgi:uncharacterized membrane protein
MHSFVSRLLPVPDAALGAIGYVAELIGSAIGGEERWREMPRFVLAYGALVALATLTAVGLVALQLFIIRAACTLCLVSAAISIAIGWLGRKEVAASLQSLRNNL